MLPATGWTVDLIQVTVYGLDNATVVDTVNLTPPITLPYSQAWGYSPTVESK
ncbi:MAG: hypothetical protein R2848_11720 [Thermomicrobiales bacterium]